MAYGKNKGRFREIRVGRFVPNMGAQRPPVKSTDIEEGPAAQSLLPQSCKIHPQGCNLKKCTIIFHTFLNWRRSGKAPSALQFRIGLHLGIPIVEQPTILGAKF